ncbi:FecR domain-containing protein [Massilibacteroides sp.]|uniref:FecR family protein n=1 Tax=Massilibacteroides sp. TaxID=2034766 RepID=UPI0026083815|nr:FecR domain-containing protein [Massilibacteroides sp.]MDD4514032.1 FecR domain-containing protein [Massilibacteroides sp.]
MDSIYTIDDINALSDLRRNTKPLEEEMDACWEEAGYISTSADEYEMHKEEARVLLRKIKRKEKHLRLIPLLRYASVAAILLVLIISAFRFISIIPQDESPVLYEEVYVANGERKKITLPDGSDIMLNSGSYLRYPSHFSGNTRTIEVNGEAFLDVHPDSTKQFIVHTQSIDVKVLGTSFNVKAYADDEQVMVSVRTGKVQVDMAEASMNLKPNEIILLNTTNGELEKRNIDNRKATAWMSGELYFNKTPITAVAKELERYYNCKIVIEDEVLKQEYVYGEHSNESLESVLKAIEYAVGIKNKREGNQIILYK